MSSKAFRFRRKTGHCEDLDLEVTNVVQAAPAASQASKAVYAEIVVTPELMPSALRDPYDDDEEDVDDEGGDDDAADVDDGYAADDYYDDGDCDDDAAAEYDDVAA